MLLTENDIKAELSYAYLHAVVSRAGFGCEVTGRLSDGAGVDAVLRIRERLVPPPSLVEFTVDVQLKATSSEPVVRDDHYSFWLIRRQYDKLRMTEIRNPRILVVLFLPPEASQWMEQSVEAMLLRRCAWWVSLYDAPPTDNQTGQTVYLPRQNVFSVDGLRDLLTRLATGEMIPYAS
jgi:hypothetical protein